MAVEDEVQEIKKEIVQSHNLIIKTDNLIKNLAAEIRQIQKKQESYERKYWINSVAAYVIIAALCFIGVYVGFEAKIDVVRREKAQLEEDLDKARSEAEDLQAKLSVRSQQEKAAEHLLRLKREKRDDEALKVAEGLDINRLSPVLGRLVTRETEDLRLKIGAESLEQGKSLYQRGYLKRSQQEFDRAIEVGPPSEILSDAHYQRAQLDLKLNKTAKAAEDFLLAVAAAPQAAYADYALYQGASALEASGDVPRALEAYQRVVNEYPACRWVSPSKRRIARLTPDKDKERAPAPKPQPKPEPKPKPAPEPEPAPAPATKPDAAGTPAAADQ